MNYCDDCVGCTGPHPIYGWENASCCHYAFGPKMVWVTNGEYSEECGFEVDLNYCEEIWGDVFLDEDTCLVHPTHCGWNIQDQWGGL